MGLSAHQNLPVIESAQANSLGSVEKNRKASKNPPIEPESKLLTTAHGMAIR
jgi:hypothetical protein